MSKGMIVVKNIEILKTDKDPIELLSTIPPYEPIWCEGEPVQHEVLAELIRGRHFHRPSDGAEIVVGVSKQAQEVMGILYESWDELQKANDELQKANDELQKAYENERKSYQLTASKMHWYKNRVEEARSASIWRRLKGLIRGYKDVD